MTSSPPFSLLYAFGYVGVGRLMDKIGVKRGLAGSVGVWSVFGLPARGHG